MYLCFSIDGPGPKYTLQKDNSMWQLGLFILYIYINHFVLSCSGNFDKHESWVKRVCWMISSAMICPPKSLHGFCSLKNKIGQSFHSLIQSPIQNNISIVILTSKTWIWPQSLKTFPCPWYQLFLMFLTPLLLNRNDTTWDTCHVPLRPIVHSPTCIHTVYLDCFRYLPEHGIVSVSASNRH